MDANYRRLLGWDDAWGESFPTYDLKKKYLPEV